MQAGFAMKALLDAKNSHAFVCAAEASRTSPDMQSRHANRIRGPLTVEIVGRFDAPRGSGFGTRYVIRVKPPTDTNGWLICQRYSRFEAVRHAMAARFPDLPVLPPKSEFRRRFSKAFRERRQTGLEQFLRQAVMADEFADTPALRDFLSGDDLNDSWRERDAQQSVHCKLQSAVRNRSSSTLMETKARQLGSFASTASTSTPCSRHSLAFIPEIDESSEHTAVDMRFHDQPRERRRSTVKVPPNWVQIELDYMGVRDWDMD